MRVEVLYFDGCPSHARLLPRVQALVRELGSPARVTPRRIDSVEQAEAERFLGSPTIRIDGRDIEPGADERTDFGLKCRIYRSAEGMHGTPPEAWLRAALAPGRPRKTRPRSRARARETDGGARDRR